MLLCAESRGALAPDGVTTSAAVGMVLIGSWTSLEIPRMVVEEGRVAGRLWQVDHAWSYRPIAVERQGRSPVDS
ncbi:MAG: hypothetical protein ACK42I_00945 [Thermomicrobium sp.]